MNIKLLHSILEDVVGQIDSESTVTIDHNELVISSSLKIWDNMNNTDIHLINNASEIVSNNENNIILLSYDEQKGEVIEKKPGSILREAILGSGWYYWENGGKSMYYRRLFHSFG